MFSHTDFDAQISRLKWATACAAFENSARRFETVRRKAGFDPDQPRDELGRWTDSGGSDSDVEEILAIARRTNLAAGPAAYQRCLDLCYPLLERRQRPGSDRNKWDFHKCMDACLRRNLN